jgi:hypothetical protein
MDISPITPEEIEVLFERMHQAGWNTQENLLWGYFFTLPDTKRLVSTVKCFSALGYHVVRVEPDEKSFIWLHVEYFERHTPASLFERNVALTKLAKQMELRSYDGCDVRPLETPIKK